MQAIGYLRVSTSEQDENGHGLDAQRAAVSAWALQHDAELLEVVEVASGKNVTHRPKLEAALGMLDAGAADAIVVAKLDRLARSTQDFGAIIERADRHAWNIVAIDFNLDLRTPSGRLVANVLMSVAQWERETIGLRTREGLAAAKAKGVKLGGPRGRRIPAPVERRIRREHAQGVSMNEIANRLEEDGVPTAYGKRWHASSVRAILRRPEQLTLR